MEKEFIREVPDSECCILFIHGILGTPRHFCFLFDLIPEKVSYYDILLDGHGGTAFSFSKSNMKKWKNQVHGLVQKLSKMHQRLIFVCHSMGCLFAIEESLYLKNSELFLLNLPLKIHMTKELFKMMWKCYTGKAKKEDRKYLSTMEATSITLSKNPFVYLLWTKNYLSLFAEMKKVRKSLKQHPIKGTCFYSVKDEMVSEKTISYVLKFPEMKIYEMKDSGHFFYEENDRNLIRHEFEELMARIS